MNYIYWIFKSILEITSEITGFSFYELNSILYIIILPLIWIALADRLFRFHYIKLSFVLLVVITAPFINSFKEFSNSFNNSLASMVNQLTITGLSYNTSSLLVYFLVPASITLFMLIFVLFYKNRIFNKIQTKGVLMLTITTIGSSILIIFIIFVLFFFSFINFGACGISYSPPFKDFPVRGIDISKHQGNIEWDKLKEEKLDFVILKGTEGESYVDINFQANFNNALKEGYKVGVYHFFRFCVSGEQQASNFISNVPNDSWLMPPIIDLETYGHLCIECMAPDTVKMMKQLGVYIKQIESYYHKSPIIYCNYNFYENYLRKAALKNKIWIAYYGYFPYQQKDYNFILWQYTSCGILKGINGNVDLNVFNGTKAELFDW